MRVARKHSREKGDTIIEVIFAMVIFSFAAISSLTIMNQGIAISERALEVTLVRQQISAQAEALRFIREATIMSPDSDHAGTWEEFRTKYAQEDASPYGADSSGCRSLTESAYQPFILNARTATVWGSAPAVEMSSSLYPPYSQVVYDDNDSSILAAYGIWIESVPSDTPVLRQFIDFHIRACWAAPGSSQPMTIGTIVRLYDPTV